MQKNDYNSFDGSYTYSLHLLGSEFSDVADLDAVSRLLDLLQGVALERAHWLHL